MGSTLPGELPKGINPPHGATLKPECPCCGEGCDCAVKPCGKSSCRCVLSSKKPCPKPECRADLSAGVVEADGTVNFGLNTDAIKKGQYILNGHAVTKDAMMQAIVKPSGKPSIPDDSKQLAVTVIGNEADRKQVLTDLESSPALTPWKNKIKVQGYEPSHWAVKDAGFVTTGKPTIYCQAPDGTVLHRQDSYQGPEALAEALRKADASYKPEKDPNLNKPLSTVPVWVWVAGGAVIFLLLKGGEK